MCNALTLPSIHARQWRLLLFSCSLLFLLAAWPALAQTGNASLRWHKAVFSGVMSYSPTGALIAEVQGFGEIALYHANGTLAQTISTGQNTGICSLAFSADGTMLASGGVDTTIKIWRVSDGALLESLTGHTDIVDSVAFSPDGATLASGSDDTTIKLWRVSDGTLLNTLNGHTDYVMSVAFSPSGTTLVSGSMDTTVKLWSLNGTLLQTLTGTNAGVYTVAFAPNGQTVAAGSADASGAGMVNLWNISAGTQSATLTGQLASVLAVAFSPDGQTVLAGSADNTMMLWSVNGGNSLLTFSGDAGGVSAVAFTADGGTLISASWDGTVRLWQVSDATCLLTFSGASPIVYGVALAPDGQTLASGGADGSVTMWKVSDGSLLQTLQVSSGAVLSVAFSPDGQTLACGCADSTITLWRLSDNTNLQTFTGHTDEVTGVAFSPDGTTLASGSWDWTIKLWDVNDGSCLQTLIGHTDGVSSLLFAPDGNTLFSGSWDGTAIQWNVSDGASLQTFASANGSVYAIALTPDGTTLATGSWGSLQLWSVSAGTSLQTLTLPGSLGNYVSALAFTPNGGNLAYGCGDGSIYLVRVSDLTSVQAFTRYANPVNALAFTADGQQLAAGSGDGAALWALATSPLSAVALTTNPPAPAPAGTPVTLSATATGGTNLTYQFWLYNPAATPAWSQLQAYSSLNTCTWTPAVGGNYLLSASARDGSTGTQVSTTLWYSVANPPLTAVALATTPAAPQAVATPITLTAMPTGGTNVTYQFWRYNPALTPAWSQLQAFSSSSACMWTPSTAGNYLLSLTAQDGLTGMQVSTTAWYTISAGLPLTAVAVSAAPASPQSVNTPVTFTATATGGTNVQYQFWLYNPNGSPAWSQVQAFSAQAACPWTPVAAGSYLLSVTARDGSTGTEVNTSTWYIIAAGAPLTAVSFTTAPASPQQANTAITLTATATGGTGVQYQCWSYNSAATPAWSQVQAYSTQAACTWTPATAGKYLLSVSARDGSTGTEVSTTAWYTITAGAPLTAVAFTAAPAAPQPANTSITLTATATGGTNVQFQFWLYNPAATPAWSPLQAYSALATCTWKPATAGSYLLSVSAQDGSTGTVVNMTGWYTVQ